MEVSDRSGYQNAALAGVTHLPHLPSDLLIEIERAGDVGLDGRAGQR
jgi:hypothetical protein